MITDYFKELELIRKEESADELGGFATKYVFVGKFKGLLSRASTAERTIAAQLGISEVFTLMTTDDSLGIKSDMIVVSKSDGKTAIVDSESLKGEGELKDVIQWTCKTYRIPEGTVIEGEGNQL